jgi:YbgC/YbaW family acyl-CoA thioester hydrolase
MAHRTTLDVRFSELDMYGHVNHAVYVSYFEVARTEALAFCDLPIEVMAERGCHVVVTSIEVRYRRPASMGDRLTIETAIAEQRRVRSVWRQRILRDGEELVTASIHVGITDVTGRPIKPPDWLFPALRPLLNGVS